MTRFLSQIGKRAIHLSVDRLIEQIFDASASVRTTCFNRENGLHKGP